MNDSDTQTPEELEDLTLEQLRKLAKDKDISIPSAFTRKAEIVDHLRAEGASVADFEGSEPGSEPEPESEVAPDADVEPEPEPEGEGEEPAPEVSEAYAGPAPYFGDDSGPAPEGDKHSDAVGGTEPPEDESDDEGDDEGDLEVEPEVPDPDEPVTFLNSQIGQDGRRHLIGS